MKPIYIYISALTFGIMPLSSCSDSFLDKAPDERTEINTLDDVQKLLVTAYPTSNYAWLAELSSDNLQDNQAPHLPSSPNDKQVESHYNYGAYSRQDDEIYRFDPASSATYNDSDSPGQLWNHTYNSVATVNHAMQTIDKLLAEAGGLEAASASLKAAYAEALLIRAYDHFVLVNMFSQGFKDNERSRNDIGIPYVTEPETTLLKDYDRGNVTEVYDKIQADLEEGLKYVSDINYTTAPKYQFNVNAAHAFAARFYLYTRQWEKVIEHADAVLGTDSISTVGMMLDYSTFKGCATSGDYADAWQSPDLRNNLLIIDTYSLYGRRCFGYRYSLAGSKAGDVMMVHTDSPLWSGYICPGMVIVGGMLFSNSSHDYGFFNTKMGEQFQYSDKITGIGYVHTMQRAFTSNVLLLERAEAKTMLGRYDDAAEDLKLYWNGSLDTFSPEDYKAYVSSGYNKYLTKEILLRYYSDASHRNCFENWDFTAENVSSSYVIPREAVPYMNCINDFRRMETCFEGLRFFDLKRWGIEYTHEVGVDKTIYTLKADDVRRAIEIPWESLSAGMESSRPQQSAVHDKTMSLNVGDLRIKK